MRTILIVICNGCVSSRNLCLQKKGTFAMSNAQRDLLSDRAREKKLIADAATGTAGKSLLLQSALAVVIATLCCLTPVVLVLLGLASISTALSLDDTLYGHYGWVFRLAA